MKQILVIGAGLSSGALIKYLIDNAASENWMLTVGDMSVDLAKQKIGQYTNARAIFFDVNNEHQCVEEIKRADVIVSMLPAFLHIIVAKQCVLFKKHLVTASYVSDEMKALDAEAKAAGIILMNESGLDPGIDHASAMKVIDGIHAQGGEISLFKSYTGGLVAPEYSNNPWGYKFTWNPRNVVLAGQGTAEYMVDGEFKRVPYTQLFNNTEEVNVEIPLENNSAEIIQFEGYPNRDSLSYRSLYGLESISTMIRGTLRMPGYCKAWNVFVQLGLTDDSKSIAITDSLTYSQWVASYLSTDERNIIEGLQALIGEALDASTMEKLDWLGILGEGSIKENIKVEKATAAQILQNLLEKKWKLDKGDKDMIVMQHQFEYKLKNGEEKKKITSSLVVKGDGENYTAMAKTVGIPMAITTKLILQNKIKARGVLIPTSKEIYEPLLEELEILGIKFKETN